MRDARMMPDGWSYYEDCDFGFCVLCWCLCVYRALACSYPSDRYTIRLVRLVRAVEHALSDPLHPKRF